MRKITIIAILAVLISACMTSQKATSYLKEKGLLDDTCAANFPVVPDTVIKEGEVIEIVTYLPSDTITHIDTIDLGRIDTIKLICPPSKVITRWRVDTFIRTVVDSAAISAMRGTVAGKDAEIAKLFKESKEWRERAKNRSRNQWISIAANILLIFLLGWLFGKKLKKPM